MQHLLFFLVTVVVVLLLLDLVSASEGPTGAVVKQD